MADVRLIDVNAAIERAKESDKIVGSSIWETCEVVEFLEDCPIEDAVPVVHGRWISLSTLWGKKSICSVCGRDLYVNEPGNGLPNIEDLHYCPDCGARMDGDGK